jgi:Holliday junction resolvase-like predicted endonuclease
MAFYITKASGEQELFDIKKFRHSLRKAGASVSLANQIVEEIIEIHPTSTKEIHDYVIKLLARSSRPIAARYNLKRALMEFGPAGFPFEKFIAQILQKEGFKTDVNQQVYGACIWYEIDIVAEKKGKWHIIECKFHNQQGIKSDVKVALYNKARFDDIQNAKKNGTYKQAWLITNTKFTTVAVKYAECIGLKLIGWSYPHDNNLPMLIDRFGLHPITALTSLSRAQKRMLLEQGLVLCRNIDDYKKSLEKLGFSERRINQLVAESKAVCNL